jgi:MoxR-like ATPase
MELVEMRGGIMAISLPDARQLSDEVLQALRLRALRGIEQGFTETEVADLLGVAHETVCRWWTAYAAEGLDALPGGPPMLRHRVDTSMGFARIPYTELPNEREVEVAEVDPVPRENPPLRTAAREPYVADSKLAEAVDLAIALGRPLLLQGDPGCGKTRLAYAVAYALELPLEECYIKSTTRAQDLLYTYDAVNRLYDAQLGKDAPREADGRPRSQDARNYIRFGPLGRALVRAQYGRRSVVLIDEIDKADLDFPNDLLWELDRLEFQVSESGDRYRVGDQPQLRPIVIVTHNEEKALPTAFLRRCIFHYVEFPTDVTELHRILKLHKQPDDALSQRATQVVLQLRELDLSKKPGLSELLDWVGYLQAVQAPADSIDKLPCPGALLKQKSDQQRAAEAMRTR